MQFTVSQKGLFKELKLLSGAVEKKSTIPILSNFLLEIKSGLLFITGTDLDILIKTEIEVDTMFDGALCLNAKKLTDIVGAMSEAQVQFKLNAAGDQVEITSGRSRFKLAGLSKDGFPEKMVFTGDTLPIAAETLALFIQRTQFAITNEESRHTLNGVKFEAKDGQVRMIATDGHRLGYIAKQMPTNDLKIDVLIPRKAVIELARLCADAEGEIQVGVQGSHICFRAGKRSLISRMLTGQFPNYEMVIPKNQPNVLSINSQLIGAAVRRVALMTADNARAIKLELAADRLTVLAPSSEIGEAQEEISVEYRGAPITLALNSQYVLDVVGVLDSDLTLELKDGNAQALIRPKGEEAVDYKYVIMPMRL